MRAKRHAQVILCAVQKVDLIADVEPQPEGSPESFQADPRIQRKPSIAVSDPVHCAYKSNTIAAGVAEVYKAHLAGSEGVEMSLAELFRVSAALNSRYS